MQESDRNLKLQLRLRDEYLDKELRRRYQYWGEEIKQRDLKRRQNWKRERDKMEKSDKG